MMSLKAKVLRDDKTRTREEFQPIVGFEHDVGDSDLLTYNK